MNKIIFHHISFVTRLLILYAINVCDKSCARSTSVLLFYTCKHRQCQNQNESSSVSVMIPEADRQTLSRQPTASTPPPPSPQTRAATRHQRWGGGANQRRYWKRQQRADGIVCCARSQQPSFNFRLPPPLPLPLLPRR